MHTRTPVHRRAFLPLAILAAIVSTGPVLAAEQPVHGDVLVQVVEDHVRKVVSDGAGHVFSGGDEAIAFDRDGRPIICCAVTRESGEELRQVIRFGDPEPVATLEPHGRVFHPSEMVIDAGGTLWAAGQTGLVSFDGEGWHEHEERDGWEEVIVAGPDGGIWAGGSEDRPAVARFADGHWTWHDDRTGLPRLTSEWDGGVTAIQSTEDGAVWVAIGAEDARKPGGIVRFDGDRWEVHRPLGKGRDARAESLAVAPDGALWAYLSTGGDTEGGHRETPVTSYLARFDSGRWSVLEEAQGVPPVGPYDVFAPVFMEFSPDGLLWLTPREGFACTRLVSFDGERTTRYIETACIRDLAVAPDGSVWVSAEWLTSYGAESYDAGIYVVSRSEVPVLRGARELALPESPEARLLADATIACQALAEGPEAREMCEVVAPSIVEAAEEAQRLCEADGANPDAAGWCLAFMGPMLLDALTPPPWREWMDVGVARDYLDLAQGWPSVPDEVRRGPKGGVDVDGVLISAAARHETFADGLESLAAPDQARYLVADVVDRARELARTERALARDPQDVAAWHGYLAALRAADAAETELRWVIGLPPRPDAVPALTVLLDRGFWSPRERRSKPVRALVEGRTGHAATLLADGRVLLTGGHDEDDAEIRSIELFEPASASFSRGGDLGRARVGHAATLLADGTVLVIGGRGSRHGRRIASLETYDPATRSSSSVPRPRGLSSADVVAGLDDGRVLVVGSTSEAVAAAWLYDHRTRSFAELAAAQEPRAEGTATTLDDGRVLLVGGRADDDYLAVDAEVLDADSGSVTLVGRPTRSRAGHTATKLKDGRVLIVGGDGGGGATLASAELFDPGTARFVPVGALHRARTRHTATLLADGRVLIAGGEEDGFRGALGTAEIFDVGTGRFTLAGSLVEGRVGHTATRLADGSVLLAGGGRARGATAEMYRPADQRSVPVGADATR